MSKNLKLVIALLVLAAVIAVIPPLIIHHSGFGGADRPAEEVVIAPDYGPWADFLIAPPERQRGFFLPSGRAWLSSAGYLDIG